MLTDNEDQFVPHGSVPIDAETGETKEGYKEIEEAPEASAEETKEEEGKEEASSEKPEASTEGTEDAPEPPPESTEGKTPETPETPVASEEIKPEEKPEDSSLHNKEYSVSNLMEDYDSNLKEGDATFKEVFERGARVIENLDPMDIIEEGLILASNGEITDIELDVALEQYDKLFLSDSEKEELIEDGEMTEREFKLLQAKFDTAVRENRRILEDDKASIDLNSLIINRPEQASETGSKVMSEEEQQNLRSSFEEVLQNYDSETLKVVSSEGEEIAIEFANNDEAKTKLLDVVSNPQGLFSLWMNEDGTFNNDKYISDVNTILNKQSMFKAVYDQSGAAKTEEIVKDRDNITDVKREVSGDGEKIMSMHDAALHNMGGGS